jgi:hypothetical protein
MARRPKPAPPIERNPRIAGLNQRTSNPTAKRVGDLGVDQVRDVQLLACQRPAGRAIVKQRG